MTRSQSRSRPGLPVLTPSTSPRPRAEKAFLQSFSGNLHPFLVKVSRSRLLSYSPPFVRNGSRGHVDDPFQSPPRSQRFSSGQATPKSKVSRKELSENWRSGSGSSSQSELSSPSHSKAQRISQRNDESQQENSIYVQEHVPDSPGRKFIGYAAVKAEDAQAFYPPSCCVFVAK